MITKASLFISSILSNFIDGGGTFSWNRIKNTYQRDLYNSGNFHKVDKDFFDIIEKLQSDECIGYIHSDHYLDTSFHITLYTRGDYWSFMKWEDWEDSNTKSTGVSYRRVLLSSLGYDEKINIILSHNKNTLKIQKINDFKQSVVMENFSDNGSYTKEINELKSYFSKYLFKLPYKENY